MNLDVFDALKELAESDALVTKVLSEFPVIYTSLFRNG